MELKQAIVERHSVRSYLDKVIDNDVRQQLQQVVDNCNQQSGLHLQLVWDEPQAFDSFMAHYGKFSGVTNYVALIGANGKDEEVGYFGEKVALAAQCLGLNTCWVAMTYKKVKSAFVVGKGEKLYCVLSLGYGATQGVAHKTKTFAQVAPAVKDAPDWFVDGVDAALLAPTAMNQQKFVLGLDADGKVTAKAGIGFYSKIDLGIVKCHFEIGAGNAFLGWAK